MGVHKKAVSNVSAASWVGDRVSLFMLIGTSVCWSIVGRHDKMKWWRRASVVQSESGICHVYESVLKYVSISIVRIYNIFMCVRVWCVSSSQERKNERREREARVTGRGIRLGCPFNMVIHDTHTLRVKVVSARQSPRTTNISFSIRGNITQITWILGNHACIFSVPRLNHVDGYFYSIIPHS